MDFIEKAFECDNKVQFDVNTPRQKIVYLSMAVLYLICEIYYILRTRKIFETQPHLKKDFIVLYLFFCIHLLLVRTFLYFLGGSIFCYPGEFYGFIDTYCYKFKRSAFVLLLYKFMKLLSKYEALAFSKHRPERILLVFEVVDLITFTCLYSTGQRDLLFLKDRSFHYDIVADTIITAVFVYASARMLSNEQLRKIFTPDFYIFLAIIAGREIMHVYFKLWGLIKTSNQGPGETFKSLYWSFFNVVYYLVSELIPCTAMLMSFSVSRVRSNRSEMCEED
eukprot:TRINITY_DN14382_c0_g4_i1.p1 TRINITY_DN14382_c0_g4~~TRINITY_DN14382_c0_g4_i1.p1  ORF type:complete len:279 (+),score=15.81 TRINITY_DN14382_c0_g4_i1:121-957(+)